MKALIVLILMAALLGSSTFASNGAKEPVLSEDHAGIKCVRLMDELLAPVRTPAICTQEAAAKWAAMDAVLAAVDNKESLKKIERLKTELKQKAAVQSDCEQNTFMVPCMKVMRTRYETGATSR